MTDKTATEITLTNRTSRPIRDLATPFFANGPVARHLGQEPHPLTNVHEHLHSTGHMM